ncbi:MAG: protein-glutamate O-methyltransferase CheR [Actinobacteria bacterium]|nr:protein-glutamate O-methyltransferase CheR [Actinomycetota bacterium]
MALDFKNEKNRTLDDHEFYAIRDYIYEICGIYFRLEKKYLIEDSLLGRLSSLSLSNINEYIYYLKYHPKKEQELKILYDFITINETSFFRNQPQLNAFEKEVLPEVMFNCRKTFSSSIKIWSAGCSSGEEPYTLSIIINDYPDPEIRKFFFEVLACDINDKVLGKAKAGIYTDYSLRNTEEPVKKACFENIAENKYSIRVKYRSMVKFEHINLLDENKISTLGKFDIIFCRNVLIYFDLESKKRVISCFYNLLKPQGYLFLGHSESLHGLTDVFKLMLFKGAIAYKKE